MAKCIRIIKDDKVIRVPDNMAADLVAEGKAEYSNKSDWKAFGREHGKAVKKWAIS